MPGASVRNPARDKVMRKEADIRSHPGFCNDQSKYAKPGHRVVFNYGRNINELRKLISCVCQMSQNT